MFWGEVLKSVWALLKIYGGLLVGVAALGLFVATIWLIGTGIGRGLEWLGASTLLTKAWAVIVTGVKKWAEFCIAVVCLALLVLRIAVALTFKALLLLILAAGLWLLVYFAILGGTKNQAAAPWALGSLIISIPTCLIGWPLLLRMDKERPKLSHLPIVIAVAVFWVAPIIAALPIALTSD